MSEITFSFGENVIKLIDELRKEIKARSRSAVLRTALTLLKLALDARRNGAELTIKMDGKEQRIIIGRQKAVEVQDEG